MFFLTQILRLSSPQVTKIGRMPQQSDKFFTDFDLLTTLASLLCVFCFGWNLNLWNTDPPIIGQVRRIRFLLFRICCLLFGVCCLGFGIWDLGFGIYCLILAIPGS